MYKLDIESYQIDSLPINNPSIYILSTFKCYYVHYIRYIAIH